MSSYISSIIKCLKITKKCLLIEINDNWYKGKIKQRKHWNTWRRAEINDFGSIIANDLKIDIDVTNRPRKTTIMF